MKKHAQLNWLFTVLILSLLASLGWYAVAKFYTAVQIAHEDSIRPYDQYRLFILVVSLVTGMVGRKRWVLYWVVFSVVQSVMIVVLFPADPLIPLGIVLTWVICLFGMWYGSLLAEMIVRIVRKCSSR